MSWHQNKSHGQDQWSQAPWKTRQGTQRQQRSSSPQGHGTQHQWPRGSDQTWQKPKSASPRNPWYPEGVATRAVSPKTTPEPKQVFPRDFREKASSSTTGQAQAKPDQAKSALQGEGQSPHGGQEEAKEKAKRTSKNARRQIAKSKANEEIGTVTEQASFALTSANQAWSVTQAWSTQHTALEQEAATLRARNTTLGTSSAYYEGKYRVCLERIDDLNARLDDAQKAKEKAIKEKDEAQAQLNDMLRQTAADAAKRERDRDRDRDRDRRNRKERAEKDAEVPAAAPKEAPPAATQTTTSGPPGKACIEIVPPTKHQPVKEKAARSRQASADKGPIATVNRQASASSITSSKRQKTP